MRLLARRHLCPAPTYAGDMFESAPLSLAEWVVLCVVDEAPTHGFAIASMTALDGPLGRVWQIPRPVIYRSLARLGAAGLVAPHGVEPGNGPQRELYTTTPQGASEAATWLDTPVDHVRDVRSQLLMKLALLDRRGRDATDLVLRQRRVLAPIADALDQAPPEGPGGFEATLIAWRRATAAATLAFLDEVAATGGGAQGLGQAPTEAPA